MYKIGDVSSRVGISVRSLRHLDQMGILKPSFRDPNGNRKYSDDDVDKLSYINLLQLAGFSLREIPPLLEKSDVRDAFTVHCQMLKNKGKYYQLLGEFLDETVADLSLKKPFAVLKEFRAKLDGMSAHFHSQEALENQSDEEMHGELLALLRKFADADADHVLSYKKLIQNIPQLLNDSYFDSFMLMIRLYKSNAFKLGELDQIEKNFAIVKKQLASDIV